LRADQEKAVSWKRGIPFIALFVLVLALGLSIALPRILADSGFGCDVMGGDWVVGNGSEGEGCFFVGQFKN
jgi:hypothetical protein